MIEQLRRIVANPTAGSEANEVIKQDGLHPDDLPRTLQAVIGLAHRFAVRDCFVAFNPSQRQPGLAMTAGDPL